MKLLQAALKNYENMFSHVYPLCFNNKREYIEWIQLEEYAPTKPIRKFICRDCTQSYQKQMIRENRCINSNIDVSKLIK